MSTGLSAVFDRYPRFDELTGWLREFADEYPDLVELDTIGSSYDGRELWLLTVTNRATGNHAHKPALWLDGNIHATEVTATVALVHLVNLLCAGYGTDPRITRALDTRTFYIVPRLNPDGAELALAEVPTVVRSTTRPWPIAEQLDGLIPGDIDHDGRQLQMRVVDPNGMWKAYGPDPRLLVAREPDDDGTGPYYRLLTEGRVQGYDGMQVQAAPQMAGIDSNRNFPAGWVRKVPGGAGGGGDYPGSEPEVAALLAAVTARPNICGYFAYHTFAGYHLRPFCDQPDSAYPADDLWTYEALGERATAITGYPCASTWHGFRYHPSEVITGVSTDFMYGHLGVYAWVTEFWNPLHAAGLHDRHPIDWYRVHSLDDELQLLAWVDDNVNDGYVDWYPYDHPELGPVELGGWHIAKVFRNPPPHLLEAEVAPHSELALYQALCSPLLRHRQTEVESLGPESWRVRVAVENTGWMPTNVTQRAIEQGAVQPLVARIALPSEASLAAGTERITLGQLTGRALHTSAMRQFGTIDPATDMAIAEWIVTAPAGTEVTVEFQHDRAGRVNVSITLT
ncbi:MAG TPA: M14 family metallopeptidase [Ilumatobacter sp.]|nr:M14 family metallopeptidase [Ilumatobacter sp.]